MDSKIKCLWIITDVTKMPVTLSTTRKEKRGELSAQNPNPQEASALSCLFPRREVYFLPTRTVRKDVCEGGDPDREPYKHYLNWAFKHFRDHQTQGWHKLYVASATFAPQIHRPSNSKT